MERLLQGMAELCKRNNDTILRDSGFSLAKAKFWKRNKDTILLDRGFSLGRGESWKRNTDTFLLVSGFSLVVISVIFSILNQSLAWNILVGLSFAFFCYALWRKWRAYRLRARNNNNSSNNNNNSNGIDSERVFLENLPGMPKRFEYQALEKATENFSRMIGAGAFGTVYEGFDGETKTRIAVKALKGVEEGDTSFYHEATVISSLNHSNLIGLVGVCTEATHRILVYEFMENGSLDRWIFANSPEKRGQLDWKTRCTIALDTAKGLAYLHEESRSCILHLDMKPENILLDEHFKAKVSDFGLARSLKRDLESRLMTGCMRGTPGYMAPEWLYNRGITLKSDVFSFGIVLLEMISGRRCVINSENEALWYLPSVAFFLARQGRFDELLDAHLERPKHMEEIVLLIKIALWCVLGNPSLRPTMSAVVQMLEGDLVILDPPSFPDIPFAPSICASGEISGCNFRNGTSPITFSSDSGCNFNGNASPFTSIVEREFNV